MRRGFVICKLFILLVFSFLLFQHSFSNGGTYDHCHFRKTGNIRLMQKADVKLLKEDLKITIKGDYSFVEVKYALQNNGDNQKIYYGFPVDAFMAGDCISPACGVEAMHLSSPYKDMEAYCFDTIVSEFKIFKGKVPLNTSYWVIDSAYSAASSLGYDRNVDIVRKWYQVYFEMTKGEKIELSVSYKIHNGFHDRWPGFFSTPGFDDRNFTYHMTPSGNWGNGIVDEFNVVINADELSSPAHRLEIEGLADLNKKGNTFSASYKNFDLSKSDRINISYLQSTRLWSEFISRHAMDKSYIRYYTTNSTDKNLDNLFDGDPKTVWIGKPGDHIVIYFDTVNTRKPRYSYVNGKITDTSYYYEMPRAIVGLNGNFSSENDLEKSSKVRITKINVNDEGFVNSEPWNTDKGKLYWEVDVRKYSGQMDEYPMGDVSVFGDGLSFYGNKHNYGSVHKIKIYFSDIYKGEEDEFTISELIFIK